MTQSRRSFSVGDKGSSMFNACSIIFTDQNSFLRIVNSLQTNENTSTSSSNTLSSQPNKIHKLVRVVNQNKNELIEEHPEMIDILNEKYDMNSEDFSVSSFPKMIDGCYAVYVSYDDDNNIICNTRVFMSPSFKKRYIRYLLHEFDETTVEKFISMGFR